MSVISAYTIHSTALKQSQEIAAMREGINLEPSFTFSEQDKDSFVEHMTAGVKEMVRPVEEAILTKTDELLQSQGQLEAVLVGEDKRVEENRDILIQIHQTMNRVPIYRQKLLQIKKEMANIERRTSRLGTKSQQLKATRDKILENERLQAAKLAKLEARVVTTTPTPGNSSGKVAVVRE